MENSDIVTDRVPELAVTSTPTPGLSVLPSNSDDAISDDGIVLTDGWDCSMELCHGNGSDATRSPNHSSSSLFNDDSSDDVIISGSGDGGGDGDGAATSY